MSIRVLALGLIGFLTGALTVIVLTRAPELGRTGERARSVDIPRPLANDEFEAVERRLRDMRNSEWNLREDMQPCFPGSRLCFLLSHRAGVL